MFLLYFDSDLIFRDSSFREQNPLLISPMEVTLISPVLFWVGTTILYLANIY